MTDSNGMVIVLVLKKTAKILDKRLRNNSNYIEPKITNSTTVVSTRSFSTELLKQSTFSTISTILFKIKLEIFFNLNNANFISIIFNQILNVECIICLNSAFLKISTNC